MCGVQSISMKFHGKVSSYHFRYQCFPETCLFLVTLWGTRLMIWPPTRPYPMSRRTQDNYCCSIHGQKVLWIYKPITAASETTVGMMLIITPLILALIHSQMWVWACTWRCRVGTICVCISPLRTYLIRILLSFPNTRSRVYG